VTHNSSAAKSTSWIRWRGIWLGLAFVFLGGATVLSADTLGGDKAPQQQAQNKASLGPVQLIVRGPDELVVGQRCTLEIFILNSGTSPVKDLEFHARLDANLEQDSKEREHRVAIEPIAPDDVQVVRLNVTPRKVGPGGIDLTLRAKNGATEELRHVWPVGPEDPSRQTEATQGAYDLKFKITPLKECLADRPSIVLVNVLNTASKPMPGKLDLVVCHASLGRAGQVIATPAAQPAAARDEASKKIAALATIGSGNPTRQSPIALPALGPGESQTVPVRLTPRRIGDLGIAIIRATTAKQANPEVLATARLKVKFDPKMPPEQLVSLRPDAPRAAHLPQKLAEVPEVSLEDPCSPMKADEAFEHVAHLIEKINHVNTTKTDAFVEALVSRRADVRGLPFIMGDACRLSSERGQHFLSELSVLRGAMANPANLASHLPNPAGHATEAAIQARIAALVQVLGPEGEQVGRQTVKYLGSVAHSQATTALARIAIFAEEESVRRDAVAVLQTRREKDFSNILVAGLNYPWPAVAQRAADAIVQLKRQDLLPQLVEVLERPDPRAPQLQQKDGKQVPVVRELVRINHLRNCLLCHSPMDPAKAPAAPDLQMLRKERDESSRRVGLAAAGGLTAPVPLPGQALPTPTPSGGYGQFTVPDTLLTFDVTYLRQDFSVKLPVANAKPWPEQQRFDFLVRTRELTEKEADAYRVLLRPQDGDLSPYQRAAVASLRQLTGRNTEPTAAAWRQLLAQSEK
jgi:hypothetical protein